MIVRGTPGCGSSCSPSSRLVGSRVKDTPCTSVRSDRTVRNGLGQRLHARAKPVVHRAQARKRVHSVSAAALIRARITPWGGSARSGRRDSGSACIQASSQPEDVPVYDHLASQFAACDRWFSSMADQLYCLGHHDRFAYFTKTGLPWKTMLNLRVRSEDPSFLEDAAHGTLPSVSWIDPNWGNFNPFGFEQNDDHPTADISDGQDLVLAVYHALATSPQWDKTLLVIFYDEHGGFFDHVPPPEADDDDPENFGRYGVRVPAMIVSPWVEPASVSHTLFDHTSVIKTILLRFCAADLKDRDRRERLSAWLRTGHPRYLGTRVAHANNLGELLTRPAPAHLGLITAAAARSAEQARAAAGKPEPDPQPQTDWQKHIATATHLLRSRGHPIDRT